MSQADFCGEAIPVCDLVTLNDFMGDNTMSMGNTGDPICDGEAIENAIWFPFVAGNTEILIDYILTNCVQGTDGCTGDGVQIAIWSGCPDDEGTCIAGSADCITTDGSISLSGLVIGEVYNFLLDGCCGSTCTVELDVTVTDWFFEIIPDASDITISSELDSRAGCEEIAQNVFCPGQEVFVVAEGASGQFGMDDVEGRYSWTITGPNPEGVLWDAGIESGTGLDVAYGATDGEMTGGNIVVIEFSEIGNYEICLTEVETICDSLMGGPICGIVTIANREDQDFGQFDLCYNDIIFNGETFTPPIFIDSITGIEYDWNDDTAITASDILANGGEVSATIDDGCCIFNQQIQINLISPTAASSIDFQLYECQLPYNVNVNGEDVIIQDLVDFQEIQLLVIDSSGLEDFNGNSCDSLIIINAQEIVLLDSFVVRCVPDGLSVEAVVYRADGVPFELRSPTWIWRDSISNTVIDSFSNPIILDEGGTYYLDFSGMVVDINTGSEFQCTGVIDAFKLEAKDVDDSSVIMQYPDIDQDGFGADTVAVFNCILLSGYVTNNQDCNDSDTEINPDATEIPNNGIDENCDGEVILSSTYNLGTSSLRVFPNPTRDYLHIEVNNKQELYIELYNMSGELIVKSVGVEGIDLRTYPNGLYNLLLRDENDSVIVKVLKH